MADLALPVAACRNSHCDLCDLHAGVKTVCVPTVRYSGTKTSFPTDRTERLHERAIILVGEAPGANEDTQGVPFVGKAGRVLRDAYISFFKLDQKADLYLSNAVRCRPYQNKTPNKTQIKTCQGYLLADIKQLQRIYDEVIVLALGGPALTSVMGCSLRKMTTQQGEFTDFRQTIGGQKKFDTILDGITQSVKQDQLESSYPNPCRVFATYHPAYLLRNPSAGLAVHSHIRLLVDYLDGQDTFEQTDELEIAIAPYPPKYSFPKLAFDLETYGFFKGLPVQTMFHPLKMEKYDNVRRQDIIQTAALTWSDPEGKLCHAVFQMDRPSHRRILWGWFRKIRNDPEFRFLVGHNINFDLVVLRYCYPECRAWVEYPLPIMDTIVTNYLKDEGRPERSLKNLAPLLRITKYKIELEEKAYKNSADPKVWQYNCKDTFATYRIQEKLEEEIAAFYGADTAKLSKFCYQWYSELLWLIVWMTESGIALNPKRVWKLFRAALKRYDAVIEEAKSEYGITLRGEGSEKAKRALMEEAFLAVPEELHDSLELKKTDTGKISFKVENRNALVEVIPNDHPVQAKLAIVGKYQDISGLLDRYLYPIVVGRGKKHDDYSTKWINDVIYPKWFPVPSEFDDNSSGGTKQARIVCKGPPAQTFPKSVKRAIWSRFANGTRIWFDYSQIELRVAALLSGDPVMMEEYMGAPDLHTKTAKLIFGDDIVEHPEFKAKYRQAGKTLNFLVLFRGGAKKFQETLLRDIGIDYPLLKCQQAIDAFWARHRRLIEWQDEMIRFVRKHDYFELPLIGQSRLFLGGKKAKDKAINEIVNLPVQAVAADIMESAQFHLWWGLKQAGVKSLVPINVYDAAHIEGAKTERFRILKVMDAVLPNPPYYQALCVELGRTLPLAYEVTERKIQKIA